MNVTVRLDRRGSDQETVVARRRVLIVTSSYAPTMIADMHRARHLAWELPKLGWDVEILAPDESYQPTSCLDDDSRAFFPTSGKVTFVSPFLPSLFRWLGIGTIGWRAIVPMFFTGNKIIRRNIDVIYFSTTQFSLFLLGPLWRSWFGVPYVLDLHDPCVKEGDAKPQWMEQVSLKHAVTQWLAKLLEAWATRRASALVSVSPRYLDLLLRRYGAKRPEWTKSGRAVVIPFAALDDDLAEAAATTVPLEPAAKSATRIVYVGAGGPIMSRAFAAFCESLAKARIIDPHIADGVRIELYGTMLGWEQSGGRKHLAEIAEEWNLREIVHEAPGRVSYRRSLELLLGADGALILGVDDTGYMPSKLFSYALSGRPLLALLHRDGPAYRIFREKAQLGEAIWFDATEAMPFEPAVAAVSTFLKQCVQRRSVDRRSAVESYLGPAMARRHVELFEACLRNS